MAEIPLKSTSMLLRLVCLTHHASNTLRTTCSTLVSQLTFAETVRGRRPPKVTLALKTVARLTIANTTSAITSH